MNEALLALVRSALNSAYIDLFKVTILKRPGFLSVSKHALAWHIYLIGFRINVWLWQTFLISIPSHTGLTAFKLTAAHRFWHIPHCFVVPYMHKRPF